jgi:hypothetical protein
MISFKESQKCAELTKFFDLEETNPTELHKELKEDGHIDNMAAKILKLLKDHEVHSLEEVKAVGGSQYGTRIHELRRGLFDTNMYNIINLHQGKQTFFRLDKEMEIIGFNPDVKRKPKRPPE